MGRAPCCDKTGLKKGPWTPEEDQKLIDYIQSHGHGSWRTLPKNAGLSRCGKSCRLRWTNYLRPDIKRGRFSFEEEEAIIQLHSILGNKWSAIAGRLPGRTDNEIKNYWNTHIRKRLLRMGIDPVTHAPRLDLMDQLSSILNPLFYNSGQSGLSRLLGAIDPLVNSELLWLASNLLQPQPNPQNQNEIISSYQLQSHADFTNADNFGEISYNNDLSTVQNLMPWDEVAFPNLATQGNLIGHESGLSTPAMSSPAINNSCSTYLNSSTEFDEKESYCSDDYFNFQIPDLLDVSEFM